MGGHASTRHGEGAVCGRVVTLSAQTRFTRVRISALPSKPGGQGRRPRGKPNRAVRLPRMAEVEVTRDDAVLTITLNRPDVLNAINGAVHTGIATGLKDARDPEV